MYSIASNIVVDPQLASTVHRTLFDEGLITIFYNIFSFEIRLK